MTFARTDVHEFLIFCQKSHERLEALARSSEDPEGEESHRRSGQFITVLLNALAEDQLGEERITLSGEFLTHLMQVARG